LVSHILLILFVLRTFEASLVPGLSYTFAFSTPVSFRFERPRL
jgi:hypothetical protein